MVSQNSKTRRLVALCLVVTFVGSPAFAKEKDQDYSLGEDITINNRGSEYVSGSSPEAVLMRVNLWGAVSKPGIHYVPVRTDLITLLSYAGGPFGSADLTEVVVKRRTKGNEKNIAVDVKKLMSVGSNSALNPVLEANDIVVVPGSETLISNNTMLTVSFVAGVLSIILASVVLSQQVKR